MEAERNEIGQLTSIQVEIFNDLLTMSWDSIMKKYQIKSKRVLKTVIMRTALGYNWYPGHAGGNIPYLNAEKEKRLIYLINLASESQDSLYSGQVKDLAHAMKIEMILEAKHALHQRRCFNLESQLDIDIIPPSSGWLHDFCQNYNLRLVFSRAIEKERTFSCSSSKISQYFFNHSHLFNRDPRLIFGADETDMQPSGRFKVVTTENRQGFTHNQKSKKHISAMCCHSAGGIAVPPLIILSELTKFPDELKDLELSDPSIVWYASSSSGYMTELIFYYWSFLFATWITSYRAIHLPDNIKQSNILLIIDGCIAHKCPEALRLLALNNITVLVIPAHTSHILQAFDVLLASPLKSYFRKFLIEEQDAFRHSGLLISKAAQARRLYVRAFLRAWNTTASPIYCKKSFELIGVVPICPERILESPFVIHTDATMQDSVINNKIITSNVVIVELEDSLKRDKFPILCEQWTLNEYCNLLAWMQVQPMFKGKLLSNPPTLFWFDYRGVWFVMKTFLKDAVVPYEITEILNILKNVGTDSINRGENILVKGANLNSLSNIIIPIIKEKVKETCYDLLKDSIQKENDIQDMNNKIDTIVKETIYSVEHSINFEFDEEVKDLIVKSISESLDDLTNTVNLLFEENQLETN